MTGNGKGTGCSISRCLVPVEQERASYFLRTFTVQGDESSGYVRLLKHKSYELGSPGSVEIRSFLSVANSQKSKTVQWQAIPEAMLPPMLLCAEFAL